MIKFIGMPKIMQFRHINYDINQVCKRNKPTLEAHGTVKLHGTNASVCFDNKAIWFQSKRRIVTLDNDNCGWCKFGYKNEESFRELLEDIITKHNININNNIVAIYGEWCGKGITKGVGISNLDKMFVIFGVKIIPNSNECDSYWIPIENLITFPAKRIFNIEKFKTYNIKIDFNNIQNALDKMNALTKEVEDECPVAKSFLSDYKGELIGEGIVWTSKLYNNNIRWKIKGDKHTNHRKAPKVQKIINPAILNKIDKCIEEITHDWRFEQALNEVYGVDYKNNLRPDKIGDYIKWIINDTREEEYDILSRYGFTIRDVSKKLVSKAKEYYNSIEI